MRPYRIKHKPSGLYYKPFQGNSNLSKTGKVYITANNIFTYHSMDEGIDILINKNTAIYKDNIEAFRDFKEQRYRTWMVSKMVPKSEFEIEEL